MMADCLAGEMMISGRCLYFISYSFQNSHPIHRTLGLGKTERRVNEPKLVTSLLNTKISQIACGESFAAVVSNEGELFLCGRGSDGQLATGNRDDSSFFIKVRNLPHSPVAKVSCGGGHVAALLENGSIYVWGRGRNGQLGRSDHIESIAAHRLTPVECSFFKDKKILDIVSNIIFISP